MVSAICDGLWRLTGVPSLGQSGIADPGPEQPHVVVDLGDGADRRARIVPGALLLDGNGWRESLDRIDVGLLHEAEELPRVGRERFDVAALPLGVDGIEGERGLARAREPGDDRELIAGDLDRDVLEIVLAGTADDQAFLSHSLGNSGPFGFSSSRVASVSMGC